MRVKRKNGKEQLRASKQYTILHFRQSFFLLASYFWLLSLFLLTSVFYSSILLFFCLLSSVFCLLPSPLPFPIPFFLLYSSRIFPSSLWHFHLCTTFCRCHRSQNHFVLFNHSTQIVICCRGANQFPLGNTSFNRGYRYCNAVRR